MTTWQLATQFNCMQKRKSASPLDFNVLITRAISRCFRLKMDNVAHIAQLIAGSVAYVSLSTPLGQSATYTHTPMCVCVWCMGSHSWHTVHSNVCRLPHSPANWPHQELQVLCSIDHIQIDLLYTRLSVSTPSLATYTINVYRAYRITIDM